MNLQWIKKAVAGTAMALVLGIGGSTMLSTTAQAQDRDHRWHDRDDHRDRNWNRSNNSDWARRQQAERQREWALRQRERNRYVYVAPRVYPRVYSAPRVYPYGGGYYGGGYGNYGGSSYDQQKGFRDGLDRGQEDVRDGRSFNPNNSEHFRNGNSAYRAGFSRGYAEGYRQYGGRRW